MKDRIKNLINWIYAIAFVAVLVVPFCMLDTAEIIDSKLENRRMTMWPGLGFNKAINEWYGHYVEDRVGFREEAVSVYMNTIHAVFGEFSEDIHMYGKEKEVFPADEAYVRAYQHLATDERLIDDFVTYLDRTNDYLATKDIPFVFLAGLDKKTVYGEYMPDCIRVDENRESVMQMLSRKLDDVEVSYVIPIEEYEKLKQTKKIYNKKYDSAHWNDYGAMEALTLLSKKVNEKNPEVPVIKTGDFDFAMKEVEMEFISLSLKDTVPVYTLKEEYANSIIQDRELFIKLDHVPGTSVQHFINENALSDETILILQDSFLQDNWQYFAYRYREVFMISRQNYERMQYYVEELRPDVVVFENAERAFVDDLYAYVNLANVVYE